MPRQISIILAFFLFLSALGAQQNCPFMRVSVATDGWVACDNTVCRIRLCNEGSQAATNARVEVTLPPALTFISASVPASVDGSKVIFNLGAFAAGNCQDFSLTVAVDCNTAPGAAICLNATATPGDCPPSAPGWDNSDLVVNGTCLGGDSINFRVFNQGSGAMAATVGYIITEDHLMKTQGILPLIVPNDSTVITVKSPNGRTYTFQTTQTPGHPFPRPISVSVEGCGGNPGSTGYLLQYPQHNGDVHSDTYCDTVSAGIMGMEKTGFPLGYAAWHWIDRATELEYRIRFQNTGSTTVQTVTLTDTLSDWLDLSTFRPGAASHLYTWSIQNRTLTVVFPSAQLPPAAVNEPASRGFFTFHIGVSPDAPAGTLIENTARVRLDNQPPAQTDTTLHRIGENFLVSKVFTPGNKHFSLQIRPNPMGESAEFIPDSENTNLPVTLELYDTAGRLLRRLESSDGRLILRREGLPAGFYFFRYRDSGGNARSGSLVVGIDLK
ncbi:MAG: T9SS type A sorting domain-containing protein [Thermoanaerobaculia bacterium]|nr:T9SS type A sorting domain-containing protein [Thermoanaerobaculia bacterium]